MQNVPRGEALKLYLERLAAIGALWPGSPERIPVASALGRVTAAPVFARISSPHYHAAAMDGIAVCAGTTFGANETRPLQLIIGKDAFMVDTGDPLPQGCNAVIMIEDLHFRDDRTVEIIAPAVPWQHVRMVGEDFVETEMVLPSHQQVRPYDVGGPITVGISELDVFTRPRVALLPTGTELIRPGDPLEPGSVIESNSKVLGGPVAEWGGVPVLAAATRDDYDLLKQVILEYWDRCDLLAVIAGSSAGREDFTASLFQELGEVYVHGVAIKPGKPVILGSIRGKPVIGVPGYPVSAALAFEFFARPVLAHKGGLTVPAKPRAKAYLSRKTVSPLGSEEFIRVKFGRVGDRLVIQTLPRGAGAVTSLVQADAILSVPLFSEGFPAGAEVEVELLRPWEQIARTTVVVGSHDLVLDILANLIQVRHPGCRLISSHVGSMGGLTALLKGESHLAGIHLLDEPSGAYNLPYVKRILGERPMILMNLAYRTQGLLVQRGNPLEIKSLSDLARPGVRFVNRQRGSGTRLLLDYLIGQLQIEPGQVAGYEREEYTHMAIAVAVASQNADVGLGVEAAAVSLGLDFIPVGEERYDLCIPAALWEAPEVSIVRELMGDPEFRKAVAGLKGYDFRDCGKIMGTT